MAVVCRTRLTEAYETLTKPISSAAAVVAIGDAVADTSRSFCFVRLSASDPHLNLATKRFVYRLHTLRSIAGAS